MTLHCVNCGSANIEAGEAGRRDHCADCGCESFRTATVGKTPIMIPAAGPVRAETARGWFDQMHLVVDEA